MCQYPSLSSHAGTAVTIRSPSLPTAVWSPSSTAPLGPLCSATPPITPLTTLLMLSWLPSHARQELPVGAMAMVAERAGAEATATAAEAAEAMVAGAMAVEVAG